MNIHRANLGNLAFAPRPASSEAKGKTGDAVSLSRVRGRPSLTLTPVAWTVSLSERVFHLSLLSLLGLMLVLLAAPSARAAPTFDIGTPSLTEVWIDPSAAEDLRHTMKGNEVDPVALLQDFAAWTETHLPQSGPTAHDAAILLTSVDFVGSTTELTYLAQMCDSSRAVAVVQATFSRAFDAASIARAIGQLVGMCNDSPSDRSAKLCPTLPASLASGPWYSHCVMAASRNPRNPETRFSACSAYDFNDWFVNKSPRPNCLVLPKH